MIFIIARYSIFSRLSSDGNVHLDFDDIQKEMKEVCNKLEGFDLFFYWILVGFSFDIRKMCLLLIPRNFGIAGSVGVLALNGVVGGLIVSIVVAVKILGIAAEIIRLVTGHFWTKNPEVGR